MATAKKDTLSAKELETLKAIAVAWMKVYGSIMPVEFMRLYIVIYRINERLIAKQQAIKNIQITQAATITDFHKQAVMNVQNSMRMMQ